ALIAQLHAVPLDRSRPLWEYHFIEGLEGGAFAVYVKVHHSAMDGVAGMATLGVTYDFDPDARFLYSYVREMPRTPLNTAISGHRVYATSSLPLPDVRALAKSRDVT